MTKTVQKGWNAKSRTVLSAFEKDHEAMFRAIEALQDALNRLRYEGKFMVGRNIREIVDSLNYFEKDLFKHLTHEERSLFPYLEIHIPRLEPVIRLLKAEHGDLRRDLRSLRTELKRFSMIRAEARRQQAVERIRERGIYWTELLKTHMKMEKERIYRIADRELREDEKKVLVGSAKSARQGLKR